MISNVEEELLSPEKIGFSRLTAEEIRGGATVEESVRIFMNILNGKGTAAQEAVVIVNSGMALKKLFPEKTLPECFESAKDSLKGGKALSILNKLLEL
jgi:anthranilate phosphoribosyltransferase